MLHCGDPISYTNLNSKYWQDVYKRQEMFIGWNDFVETSVMPLSKKQALSLVNKIEFDESAKRAFYTELRKAFILPDTGRRKTAKNH